MTHHLVAPNLTKQELVEYAVAKYAAKQQWCHGETAWLAPDAYLKNTGSKVELIYITDKHDVKRRRYETLATVFVLKGGMWRIVVQPTPKQVWGDTTATALPVQYNRGKSVLFKE